MRADLTRLLASIDESKTKLAKNEGVLAPSGTLRPSPW
jgi:hypothetical protein